MSQPLAGVTVLDFSTLLPGPLAGLILAEAGAEVIKIERPGRGDEMRAYEPKLGADSVNFALLNRGKRSIALDLKAPDARGRLMPLIRSVDVLVEQFRPGVMDRLGLGYDALRPENPRLIWCSITGFGQSGPKAGIAAHDLNYIAETGLLALSAGPDGAPVIPPALIADIAAGAYPAVINVLLALQQRARTGKGCRLDIAMTDQLFPLMHWALGNAFAAGRWPEPGGELLTGGSPRYRIYRTADDRFLAAAPLEQRFWDRFCQLIGLEERFCDDARDPAVTITRITQIVRTRNAADWEALFGSEDVCCAVVRTLEEALCDPHFRARGLFDHELRSDGRRIPALPVPVAPEFRSTAPAASPALGEANDLLRYVPPPVSARGHADGTWPTEELEAARGRDSFGRRQPAEHPMSEPTTADPLLTLSGQLEHLAETASRAVVAIRVHGRLVASGLVWKPGVIVTASDALEADDDISVIAGADQAVPAQFAGRDPTTDVAVLRLSDDPSLPAVAITADPARVGQMVLALGRGEDGVTANLGMVSVAGGPWQSMRGGTIDRLIRLDMRLSRRSEGGLVVDSEGRGLGMAVFGPRQTPLVIPMPTIERIGAQLLADGRIRRGYLGVGLHGIRLDETLAASLSLPERRAIMVVSVDPNGPARTAGVHVGDVIVGFDGQPVPGVRSLFARLTPESVGRSAELKLVRAGQIATAEVVIAPAP